MNPFQFAQQKKKENIAEYILYLWQLEDLIRSCNFEISRLEEFLFSGNFTSESQKDKAYHWFCEIISEMKNNRAEKKGHIMEVYELLSELNFLHNSLLTVFQDKKYIQLYEKAGENIQELKQKSNKTANTDIDACFNGLYGILLLKIQKKQILPETQVAIKTISELVAYMSAKYKEMVTGRLNFPGIKNN